MQNFDFILGPSPSGCLAMERRWASGGGDHVQVNLLLSSQQLRRALEYLLRSGQCVPRISHVKAILETSFIIDAQQAVFDLQHTGPDLDIQQT
jgi:hypothetical protein